MDAMSPTKEGADPKTSPVQHLFSGSDCPDPDIFVHLSMIDAVSPWIDITAGRHPASCILCNIKM
jgi:hypothetical protein